MEKLKPCNATDITTTIGELRALMQNFRRERGWNQATADQAAKDIAAEAGELLHHFVWNEQAHKDPRIKKEISSELADVVYGICIMADALDIDIAQTVEKKLKISAQKYPKINC